MYETRLLDGALCLVDTQNNLTIVKVENKNWETRFFNREFGLLTLDIERLASIDKKILYKNLKSLFNKADDGLFDLIEIPLDITAIQVIPLFEDMGCRLVDTKISYITLIDRTKIPKPAPPTGELRFVRKGDVPALVSLTHQTLTNNTAFSSRFKNSDYYTRQETENYFAAWITNSIKDPNTLFVVIDDEGRIAAYFIYKYAGMYSQKPLYKGILTAVEPKYRGNQLHLIMQAFIYHQAASDQFYVENATQLTNYATIKSHMKSKKTMKQIELVFYRLKNATSII